MLKTTHERRRRTISDPLTMALIPPPDESPIEREQRLRAEQDARKVSDNIDILLSKERAEKRRVRQQEINVLLLGQSESGKSTTLKQFQLLHAPATFHAERIAWRTVIYLNLVRSVRRILEAIAPESDVLDDQDYGESTEPAAIVITSNGRPPSAILGTKVPNFERYRRRLEPLLDLEDRLSRLLSSPDEDEATRVGPSPVGWAQIIQANGMDSQRPLANGRGQANRPAPTIVIPNTAQTTGTIQVDYRSTVNVREVAVHPRSNWKRAFALGGTSRSPKSVHSGEIEGWWEDPEDPVHTLNACAPAMQELWRDKSVRQCLKEKRIRLEESSGFYLDEINRITAKKYFPTDADVLKARLKTVGVVEHTFTIANGSNRGVEWKIYDVGGARNQRQAWAPYFEDVNAIIFLAPISAFDQVLTEDHRVNRLEDSLQLWKSVVSNKLLEKVNIVLFLNKIDLLQAKLDSGVRLNQHMKSYGDRPNDFDSVTKYFYNKFGAIHTTYTPNKERELYIHLTCVTDTRRTALIIATVRDSIIRGNLRNMRLL